MDRVDAAIAVSFGLPGNGRLVWPGRTASTIGPEAAGLPAQIHIPPGRGIYSREETEGKVRPWRRSSSTAPGPVWGGWRSAPRGAARRSAPPWRTPETASTGRPWWGSGGRCPWGCWSRRERAVWGFCAGPTAGISRPWARWCGGRHTAPSPSKRTPGRRRSARDCSLRAPSSAPGWRECPGLGGGSERACSCSPSHWRRAGPFRWRPSSVSPGWSGWRGGCAQCSPSGGRSRKRLSCRGGRFCRWMAGGCGPNCLEKFSSFTLYFRVIMCYTV